MTLTFPTWASFCIWLHRLFQSLREQIRVLSHVFYISTPHNSHLNMPRDRHPDNCYEQLSPADRHQLRTCRSGHVHHAAALASEAPAQPNDPYARADRSFPDPGKLPAAGITGENSGTGFAAIALSCINFFLFRHYERLLYTLRCPGCRHATLRGRAVNRRTYRLHCKRCGLYTDWHE